MFGAASENRAPRVIDMRGVDTLELARNNGFCVRDNRITYITTINDVTLISCDQSNPQTVTFSAKQHKLDIPFTTRHQNADGSFSNQEDLRLELTKEAHHESMPRVKLQPFYRAQNSPPSHTLIVLGWPQREVNSGEKLHEAFLIHHAPEGSNGRPMIQHLNGKTLIDSKILNAAIKFIQECTAPAAAAT